MRGGVCTRVCVPLAQAPLCLWKPDVESSPSRAVGDRVAAGSRPEKKKKSAPWPRARVALLRTGWVARDPQHAPTSVGWPRVTRAAALRRTQLGLRRQERWNYKLHAPTLRAMHWQHGQVVQGTPRIQNYKSPATGASETGLQALSHRCARYDWLPAGELRGHVPEPRSAGHPRRVQTPKGAGLRGPVHLRWKYLVRLEFEHRELAGYQVRVAEAPTHQGGNDRKEQPGAGWRCHGHAGCRRGER